MSVNMQTSLGHRRRSQSASTATTPVHRRSNNDGSWRSSATKRSHPFTSPEPGSTYKWNVDDWRSKRRRRDQSPSSDSMDDTISTRRSRTTTAPPAPAFAASSADFHLFPNRSSTRSRRRPRRSPSPIGIDDESHLTSLRSAAFWELRRSVADNGEGFVRCMRDYERSRSRVDSSSRARRGRRQSSLVQPIRSYPSAMDQWDVDDDDDDIQIFSGHVPTAFTFHPSTSSNTSLSGSTTYTSGAITASSSDQCSSPAESSASSYICDDDPILAQDNLPNNTLPATSYSSPQSTRSEKALAALTLAMANGAGSIHDYDALRTIETVVNHDDGKVGEMWR